MAAVIKHFFDHASNTFTYVVHDSETNTGVVIDPVLNYEASAGKCTTESAAEVIEYVKSQDLRIVYILETHIHADHLSATRILKKTLGGQIGIGRHVTEVQQTFANVFNIDTDFPQDGSQFDVLFEDEATFKVGNLTFTVWHTPGHTPACISFLVDNCIFVGDTLFMPDYGTARTDFPAGSAKSLYQSIQRILSLADDTQIFLCHDYGTASRKEICGQTSVAKQKNNNIHLGLHTTEADFISLREARDSKLKAPALLYQSVQFNIRSGQFPPAEQNGTHYFKIPLRLP